MDDKAFWSVVIRAALMVLRAIDHRFGCGIWTHDKPA
jgi:hypothetical protein